MFSAVRALSSFEVWSVYFAIKLSFFSFCGLVFCWVMLQVHRSSFETAFRVPWFVYGVSVCCIVVERILLWFNFRQTAMYFYLWYERSVKTILNWIALVWRSPSEDGCVPTVIQFRSLLLLNCPTLHLFWFGSNVEWQLDPFWDQIRFVWPGSFFGKLAYFYKRVVLRVWSFWTVFFSVVFFGAVVIGFSLAFLPPTKALWLIFLIKSLCTFCGDVWAFCLIFYPIGLYCLSLTAVGVIAWYIVLCLIF